VLNLGGHDVLSQPFQAPELLWVLDNAWRLGEDERAEAPTPRDYHITVWDYRRQAERRIESERQC
jgi:hypothetical protein